MMAQSSKQTSNVNQFNRYLDNNTQTLKEKFKDFFQNPFPLNNLLQSDNTQSALKYIYDIFNFSKYEANEQLNKTLRNSLIENITAFQKIQTSDTYFGPQMAVKLLRYCIENNDMFAVHYDKKKSNTNPQNAQQQPPKEQQPQPSKQPQQQPNTPPVQHPKQQVIKEQRVQSQKPLQEIPSSPSNQFQSPPPQNRQQNVQLIKRQLKEVFEFYCKQQQGINPKTTFDNISHKCKTMNLGKFMTFALASNIVYSKQKLYSEAKIDKQQLVSAFKRGAKGDRQIQFHVFLNILEELKNLDPSIYQKMGLGQDGSKGKKKMAQNMKAIVLPFSTKDQGGRQISPFGRMFVPKLTSHSGKHEQALRDELSSRKLRASQKEEGSRIQSKLLMGHYNQQTNRDEGRYSLKLGQSSRQKDTDLNFLSKLITQQDNDQIFLKDYKIPKNKLKSQNSLYGNGANDNDNYLQNGQIPDFTTRPSKAQSFILPAIGKRNRHVQMGKKGGGQTQLNPQRRSIGLPPRGPGTRNLLY